MRRDNMLEKPRSLLAHKRYGRSSTACLLGVNAIRMMSSTLKAVANCCVQQSWSHAFMSVLSRPHRRLTRPHTDGATA